MLVKIDLPLIKNVLKLLAKYILIPYAPVGDEGIHENALEVKTQ